MHYPKPNSDCGVGGRISRPELEYWVQSGRGKDWMTIHGEWEVMGFEADCDNYNLLVKLMFT